MSGMDPVIRMVVLPDGMEMPPPGTPRRCCDTFVPHGHTGLCANSVMRSGEERFWAVDPPPGTVSVREDARPLPARRAWPPFIMKYRGYYVGLVIGVIVGVLLGLGLR